MPNQNHLISGVVLFDIFNQSFHVASIRNDPGYCEQHADESGAQEKGQSISYTLETIVYYYVSEIGPFLVSKTENVM